MYNPVVSLIVPGARNVLGIERVTGPVLAETET
jgi:hypothetical protein